MNVCKQTSLSDRCFELTHRTQPLTYRKAYNIYDSLSVGIVDHKLDAVTDTKIGIPVRSCIPAAILWLAASNSLVFQYNSRLLL
jgi:hypothetical protein